VAASPDGKQFVFSDFDPSQNNGQNPFKVYTVASDGTGLQEIDTGTAHPNGFVWSPDGRWIAFHDRSYPGSSMAAVWVMAPDGTQRRKLFEYPVPGYGWLRWSPDSTHLAASSANNGAGAWVIDLATGTSIRLVQEAVWEVDWSPDSKRLVVDITDGSPPTMTGSQTRQALPIVVVNADGTGRRELVKDGAWAVWSPAGDGIALRDGYSLIDPDTLARRPYGPGAALAYAADGQHLVATGPGLLIDDRRGCGVPLVATDSRGSPTFVSWAGTNQILIKVLPPA
jgi:Tol biopolymer transport system component